MTLLAATCAAVALALASLLTRGIRHCAIVMSPFAVGCSPSPSNSCKGRTARLILLGKCAGTIWVVTVLLIMDSPMPSAVSRPALTTK